MRASSKRNEDSSILVKKGGVSGLSGLLNMPLRIGITLANTHILGPAAYGLIHVALLIINVSNQILGLGAGQGLVRFSALYNARNERSKIRFLAKKIALILLLEGLVLMVLLSIWADRIAHWLSKPGLTSILIILSPLIPLSLLGTVAISCLQGLQHVRTSSILDDIIVPPVVLGCLVIVLVMNWGLPGVLTAQLIGGVLGTLLSWIFLKKLMQFQPVTKIKTTDFWKFSLPLAGDNLVSRAIQRIDVLIVAIFLPAAQVGVYALASRLVTLIGLAQKRFNRAFGPRAVQILEEQRREDLSTFMATTSRWSLIWAGLPAMLFILAGPEVGQVFGRGFAGCALALSILAIGKLISSGCGPSGSLLTMAGHSGWTLFSTIFFFFLQVSLALILIPGMGIKGAAIATAAALIITNLLRLVLDARLVGAHPVHTRLIVLFILFGLIAWTAKIIQGTGIPRLIVAGAAIVLWGIIGYLVGLTSSERKDILFWVKGGWRKKY